MRLLSLCVRPVAVRLLLVVLLPVHRRHVLPELGLPLNLLVHRLPGLFQPRLVLPGLIQARLLDLIAARLILLNLIPAGLLLLRHWLLAVDLRIVPRDVTLLHLRVGVGPLSLIAVCCLPVNHRLRLIDLLRGPLRARLVHLLRVPLRAGLVQVLRVLLGAGLVSLPRLLLGTALVDLLRGPLRLSRLDLRLVLLGTFGLGLVLAALLLQLFRRRLRAVYLDVVARDIALFHLRISLTALTLVRLLPLAVGTIQRRGTGSGCRYGKYVGTIRTVLLLPRTVLFPARLLSVVRLTLEVLVLLALVGFAVGFEVVGYAIAVGVAQAVDLGLLQLAVAGVRDSVAVDVQRVAAVAALFALGLGVDVVAHQFLVPQGALDQAEHQHPLLVLGQVLQLGLGLRVVAHEVHDRLGHLPAFLVVELPLLLLQPAVAAPFPLRAVVVRRDDVVRAVERRRADRLSRPAAPQRPTHPLEPLPHDPRGPFQPAVQVLEQLFLDRLGLRHHATSLA
ncbi:hypothetical protein BWI15_27460 [Kribbella sp. ALI-6-A]|nr:hypothetical protein BWI15_27460 [Kribbella sp. ALI-6-A]